MKRIAILIAVGLMLAVGVTQVQAVQMISIDNVTNILDDTTLHAGNTHVISIRMQNDSAVTYNPTNAYRVFTTDGATWDSLTGAWLNGFDTHFTTAFINAFSNDGIDADTIAFSGVSFTQADGLVGGFNDLTYSISFSTSLADTGKHICIDSSWFPPGGTWKWAPLTSGHTDQISPDWSGQKCFRILQTLTDVPDLAKSGLPTNFALHQNYPNPFNPTTTIAFDVPRRAQVSLRIYNLLGQEVRNMVDEAMAPGFYTMEWDGRSTSGHRVASGIYFYKLEAGDFVKTQKMMLLK